MFIAHAIRLYPYPRTLAKMPLASEPGKVLFIDAYDSFSENIAALLCQVLGVDLTMIHIDTPIEDLLDLPSSSMQDRFPIFLQQFDAVVLGPGPGNPGLAADIGLFAEIWKLRDHQILPVLGICLGFQSLCIAYGGFVSRLPEPCHGHAKKINHCGDDIFADVGQVIATNYNSLEAKLRNPAPLVEMDAPASSSPSLEYSNPFRTTKCPKVSLNGQYFQPTRTCPKLRPLAWDDFGTLMGVKHVDLPYWGLQFHPESCKSNAACRRIIKNWWDASMHWSDGVKSTTIIPRHLLPPGHIWSRPLTPIHSSTESNGNVGSPRDVSTLLGELLMLTSSTSQSVEYHVQRLPANAGQVAELCRSLARNDTAMLESTRKGRHSIYSFPSLDDWRMEYNLGTSTCAVHRDGKKATQWKMKLLHVLDNIHALVAERNVKGGRESLPFWGGLIGFFSYEVGLERLDIAPVHQQPSTAAPDISLLWVERSIVIDHTSNEVHIQSIRKEDSTWVRDMAAKLDSPTCPQTPKIPHSEQLQALLSSAEITLPDEATYKRQIQSCQSYLQAGDSYELCLTTEAHITLPSHPDNPWLLHRNLQHHNPVPFSAFLHLGSTTILSSSPEQFLTWSRSTGTIDMIPMKGTVAKSASMTLAHAQSILASPKESAENLMIADLIRHDLHSTVGWNAPVEVIQLCEVVEHETVYQLVSHIRATPPIPPSPPPPPSPQTPPLHLKQIIHYGHKALRQTLPPGSMTGAPKKRSCEILDRLEQRRRGVYAGVLGYLDVGGGGGFSVCIRTAVSEASEDRDGRQTWRVGAGGAITVLSEVEAEWREMGTKLESVLRAFRPKD